MEDMMKVKSNVRAGCKYCWGPPPLSIGSNG
jgi:hypothetical protein